MSEAVKKAVEVARDGLTEAALCDWDGNPPSLAATAAAIAAFFRALPGHYLTTSVEGGVMLHAPWFADLVEQETRNAG